MRINILGSGTCVPSLKRHPCSVLIREKGVHILVDAGPGTMGQVLKLGVAIRDIDMILLSHFHLDHCADLAPFIFATKYPRFDRQKKLILAGGTGIRTLYDHLNTAYDGTLDMPKAFFDIVALSEAGKLDPGFKGLEIQSAKTVHNPESRAFRFIDASGFSVVYSGDTDYSEDLIALSRDAHILICESAMPDGQKVKSHLTPSLAGEIATKAGVKKLVLTHFYPECDRADVWGQCRKTYGGPLVLARDLMEI